MENGSEKKGKGRDRHNCCVPQCHEVSSQDNHMHQVPKDRSLRKKWAIAIKTGKALNDKMTVCSKHFKETDYIISLGCGKKRRLKPGIVPSVHLPLKRHDKVLTSPVKRRMKDREERAVKRAARSLSEQVDEQHGNIESASVDGESMSSCSVDYQGNDAGTSSEAANEWEDVPDIHPTDAKKMRDVGIQVQFDEDISVVSSLLSCDRRLISATGIHSVKLLNSLAEACDEIAPESNVRKFLMCTQDRIMLCMMKIKLNISFSALAAIFEITNCQTVSNYFYDTVIVLSKVLNCMVFWPDKEVILKNMPRSFNSFKSTRAILDGYEITVEKPKCIRCRIRLYSQYKKIFTAKIMMVCSPSGLVTNCSAAFGGRASDKVVTKHTGVYLKCDPGDALMVDKGFNIDDECSDYLINLIRPPFQRNKKYSRSESVQCAKIARARVHVERVIQRVREYALLRGKVPWNVCPYLDAIVLVVSALVNLSNPIMALDKY